MSYFPTTHVSVTCSLPSVPTWLKDSTPLKGSAAQDFGLLRWASSHCQNNLSRTHICECPSLAENPAQVSISYRCKSLTPAEFMYLVFWYHLPVPTVSPATFPRNTPCSSLHRCLSPGCFFHSKHFSHPSPQLLGILLGQTGLVMPSLTAQSGHFSPSSRCSLGVPLLYLQYSERL